MLLLMGALTAGFAPTVDREVASPVTTVSSEMLERLPLGRRLEDLIKTCPAQTMPTLDRAASTISLRGVAPQPTLSCMKPDDIRMIEVLRAHNDIRAVYGSRPLFWDPLLAAQARSYGPTLAGHGRPVHSPRTGREWSRENLLQALPGTPVRRMVDVWIGEGRYFKPGIFPDISLTGDWYAAGHFTQMIWPSTTAVGCATQRGIGNFDWLICRYAPPGNRDGTPVLADNSAKPVIADDSGVAAPDSSTPTLPRLDPREMARWKAGGGMTQIDPPPPPPPTARDDAPNGDESKHPLVVYAEAADAQHAIDTDCGNGLAHIDLDRMRYALDELRKRLRAARQAGQFSSIKPENVQRQIDRLEQKIREAEQRRPRPKCPVPPPPPPPPPPVP
jgi:hypothetical protein